MDKYDEVAECFFCTGFHSEVKHAGERKHCLICCRWARKRCGVEGDCFVRQMCKRNRMKSVKFLNKSAHYTSKFLYNFEYRRSLSVFIVKHTTMRCCSPSTYCAGASAYLGVCKARIGLSEAGFLKLPATEGHCTGGRRTRGPLSYSNIPLSHKEHVIALFF
jgi:hypothetical protein